MRINSFTSSRRTARTDTVAAQDELAQRLPGGALFTSRQAAAPSSRHSLICGGTLRQQGLRSQQGPQTWSLERNGERPLTASATLWATRRGGPARDFAPLLLRPTLAARDGVVPAASLPHRPSWCRSRGMSASSSPAVLGSN